MRRLALGFVVLTLLSTDAASLQAQSTATVKRRSGSVVSGQVIGLVLLSRPTTQPQKGIAYLIVEGSAVRRIDETGVHLAQGSRVRAFFATGGDGGVPDLGLPWGFLQSMGPALRDNPQFVANIGCCSISTIIGDRLTDQLLGMFQPDSREAHVVPYLHIVNGSNKTEVPIADIARTAGP